MSTDARHADGRAAEDAALRYLEGQQLTLVARNYRCRRGEIDLVLYHDDVLVFAEVRFRSDTRFGDGRASVTRAKRQRIIAAARNFLGSRCPQPWPACRFDVLSVRQPNYQVDWVVGAFTTDD
jgi:putative endonuclease